MKKILLLPILLFIFCFSLASHAYASNDMTYTHPNIVFSNPSGCSSNEYALVVSTSPTWTNSDSYLQYDGPFPASAFPRSMNVANLAGITSNTTYYTFVQCGQFPPTVLSSSSFVYNPSPTATLTPTPNPVVNNMTYTHPNIVFSNPSGCSSNEYALVVSTSPTWTNSDSYLQYDGPFPASAFPRSMNVANLAGITNNTTYYTFVQCGQFPPTVLSSSSFVYNPTPTATLTPTPTPIGNPTFTASNVEISSSHISFDITNIDPTYTDTHETFFAIEIRTPDYSQRYFYAAALPENGYTPNALTRQASCNTLTRCDVDMTSDNNGNPTEYVIEISSDNLNTGSNGLTSQVLTWPSPTLITGINTGGSAEGSFVADSNFSGGSTYSTSTVVDTSGVGNPAPEAVYQTVRYGNFTYTIEDLTPYTNYTLKLHFNELYWNAASARVFNVSANGQQVLSNYDIFQVAGGKNKAVMAQVPAIADANGDVAIQFSTVTDNAMVSGIEVYTGQLPPVTPTATPTPANPLTVNAGGGSVGIYSADNGFSGGSVYTNSNTVDTTAVTNPAPEAVYQSVRHGNFNYTMSNLTPNTNYLVRLHFNELYWNTAGQRVFNVAINGQQVLGNYDIVQAAGGANTAVVEEFVKQSNASGVITLAFSSVVDNAMVNAIELQDASSIPTYTVSGTVYNDINENGFQDEGENGLSDITVNLAGQTSVTTDTNGLYTFSNLIANVYSENVTVPNGFIVTTQNPVSLTVTANTTQNFGLVQANYAVNAGGSGVGTFLADQNYVGGSLYTTSNSVDTSGVTNPAPNAVYQTVRYGNFTYTIDNATPNSTQTVRLHFNEFYWNSVGARVFDVSVNGTQVLNNYDIFQAAGGKDKAVVADVPAIVDENGTITIQFSTVTDNAMVSGIELLN